MAKIKKSKVYAKRADEYNERKRYRMDTATSFHKLFRYSGLDIFLQADGVTVKEKGKGIIGIFKTNEIEKIFNLQTSKNAPNMYDAWQVLCEDGMDEDKALLLNSIYIKNYQQLKDFVNTRILFEKMKNPAEKVFDILQPLIPKRTPKDMLKRDFK